MTYSIKAEVNPNSGEEEFLVIDSAGIKAPPPNTFATRDAALGRLAELLRAMHPSPKMVCFGKIVEASNTLLIQHLGRDQYVVHRRADFKAFEKIEKGHLVSIVDGEVEYPERHRSPGLSM